MSGQGGDPTPAGSNIRIVALRLQRLLHAPRWPWSRGMSRLYLSVTQSTMPACRRQGLALLPMYPSARTGLAKDAGEMKNEPLEAPRKDTAPLFSLGQHNPSPPFPPREDRLRWRGLPPTGQSSLSWNSATGPGQALPEGRDTAGTLSPESHPTSHLPPPSSLQH